jgi:hypothetical protein
MLGETDLISAKLSQRQVGNLEVRGTIGTENGHCYSS